MPDTSIEIATGKLLKIVRAYESDTFSADGSKLKKYEAEQIVAQLIDNIEEGLDGITLHYILGDIRAR